jgi:hypothetical protein
MGLLRSLLRRELTSAIGQANDIVLNVLRAPWNEDALNAYLDEVLHAVKG